MPDNDDPGVSLFHYRQHQARVGLICRDCHLHRSLDLEAVIARLIARGVGDAETGVRAIAKFVNARCPRCGGKRFETRPEFPPGKPTG